MVRLGNISPEVWDQVVDFLEYKFADLDFREEDIQTDWKTDANLQRTARELYEIYGTLRVCVDVFIYPGSILYVSFLSR